MSILGYNSKEELITAIKRIADQLYVDPKKRKEFKELMEKEGKVIDFELELNRKDGTKVWIRENACSVKDQNDAVLYYEGFVLDITKQKQFEEKLKRINRINEIISNIKRIIIRNYNQQLLLEEVCKLMVQEGGYKLSWIAVLDGQFKMANIISQTGLKGEAIDNLIRQISNDKDSYSPTAEVVKTLKNYICNDIEIDQKMEPWHKALLEKGLRSFTALPFIVFGKLYGIIYLCHSENFFIDEEEMKLIAEISTNISLHIETIILEEKRKNEEKELSIAKNLAKEATRLKNSFLAITSHELRTPLSVILGSLSIIKELYYDYKNESKQLFEFIETEGTQLLHTITQIFDMTTMESGDFKINLKPIILNLIIKDCIQKLQDFAEQKQIKISTKIPNSQIIVNSDEYCLKEAVFNVFHNAIKFSDHGTITITIGREASNGIFLIKDEGIGIAENYQKHLFETFSQEEMGYSRPFVGTGLGLALTKKYMELMHGEIEIKSEIKIGTTVKLRIPLCR